MLRHVYIHISARLLLRFGYGLTYSRSTGYKHDLLSERLDVYAFGVIMWEIFARGKHAYPGVTYKRKAVEVLAKELIALQPDIHQLQDCPKPLVKVMRECWYAKPLERPSFIVITNILDKELLLTELHHPIYNNTAGGRRRVRDAAAARSSVVSEHGATESRSKSTGDATHMSNSRSHSTTQDPTTGATKAAPTDSTRIVAEALALSYKSEHGSLCSPAWAKFWVQRRLMFAEGGYEFEYVQTYYSNPAYFKFCGIVCAILFFVVTCHIVTVHHMVSVLDVNFTVAELTEVLVNGFDANVGTNGIEVVLAIDTLGRVEQIMALLVAYVLVAVLVASFIVSLIRDPLRQKLWRYVTYFVVILQWVHVVRATIALHNYNNNGFLEVNSTFQQTCNMPYRNGSVVNFTSPPLQPDPRAIDCAVTISLNDNYCSNLQSHYGSGAFETSMLWTNTVLIATALLFAVWLYRAPLRIFVVSLVPPMFVAAYYLAAMYIAIDKHSAYFPDGVMTKT